MKALIHLAIFCCVSALAQTEAYQGAEAILKQLSEKALEKPVEKKADPVEELRLKVKALQREAAALVPAEAAQRWLALMDAYLTIPREQLYSQRAHEDRLTVSTVITALPPPSAWDEIGHLLDQRKTTVPIQDGALRLFGAVLRGDEAARLQSLEKLRQSVTEQKMEDYQRESYQESIDRMAETLDQLTGSDSSKVASFEKRLKLLEEGDERTRDRYGDHLEIPDLVRFAGEEQAKALLIRVLKLGLESISFDGRATGLLASSLALENIDELKKPLWELVHTLDHATLYEALNKKFPKSGARNRRYAARVYLLALVAADRTEEALKLVKDPSATDDDGNEFSIDIGDLDEMGRQGLGAQVLAFLRRLLEEDPSMSFWRDFIELSAQQNASPAALKLLQDSLSKPGLTPKARAEMQSHHYLALLAADQRDEGIRVLRELLAEGPRSNVSDGEEVAKEMRQRWEQVGVHVTPEMLARFQQQASGMADGGEHTYLGLCNQMAVIGRLLGRPELTEEGLLAAIAAVEKMPVEDQQRAAVLEGLVEMLLRFQHGPKAEALLAGHLSHLVTPNEKQRGRPRLDEPLGLLAAIYEEAGRHEDALAVFEQSPHWGAPDLAAFESTSAGRRPLLLLAAQALAGVGRIEDAQRVIRRAVQDYPGKDPVYELLLKLWKGQPLETLLDELARRDRFEERPLIWKARVLLAAGKVDEAEKTVRAAISIDPSDGEQGKGDRMRAYAVLAEILEKKGDVDTAKIMRGAVSAIRKSEEADEWWEVGLLSEAVRRYEAALLDFADAYCVQSRLALRYSELGQFEKAEQHYLRAFELMPDSFGRVESHCFGCEGAFSGQRAQNVADKVFTRLASRPPVKAQVHYLLGYLREAQQRPVEAAASYREAVKTDPDYLNAWKELASLADTAQLTREESENAALQIFRLDPSGRHSSAGLEELRDLGRLWSTLLAAEQSLPSTETGPLLPLTAAKAAIESRQDAAGGNAWDTWSYPSFFSRRNDTREKLLQNELVQALVSFIESSGNR